MNIYNFPNFNSRFNYLNAKNKLAFTAMKKSDFDGIDFLVVEKFKAPIEKFNTNDDFQNWSQERLDEDYASDRLLSTRDSKIFTERRQVFNSWKTYLSKYTTSEILLIISSILKDVKPNNDKVPPLLKGEIVDGVLKDATDAVKSNRKFKLDFKKVYESRLADFYFKGSQLDSSNTGWIAIYGKYDDPRNYINNVDKLKVLSHKNWCTKNDSAELYLDAGDFHIYFENGKPIIGISVNGKTGVIESIEGPSNNSKFPVVYDKIVKKYIEDNAIISDEKLDLKLSKSDLILKKIDKIKQDLSDAIINRDYLKILTYFGIEVEKDKKGLLVLSEFKSPNPDFTFTDLGIDEDKMFAKISKIKGNADFSNSYVTNLGALEYIGGNVSFKDSQNINLSKLKMIDGNADFTHSKILNLSKLKAINGSAVFNRAFIRNLGNLKYIGKNADFCDSRVEDLGELRAIEGDAKFASCPLVSLNKLKTIGGNANFRFSQVRDLSKLKSIYGCADFRGCTIYNSGRLKLINGDVYISDLSELFPVSINVDLKNVVVKGETYVEKV